MSDPHPVVTETERLISRYLDGELTYSEQTRLRTLLVESPDARALLREMTVLGRAARRTPSLHRPPQAMEERLFHRLHDEGFGHRALRVKSDAEGWKGRGRVFIMGLRGLAVVAALLVAVIGGGYLLDEQTPGDTPVVAQHSGADQPSVMTDRGRAIFAPDIIVRLPHATRRSFSSGLARPVPAVGPVGIAAHDSVTEAPSAVEPVAASIISRDLDARDRDVPPSADHPEAPVPTAIPVFAEAPVIIPSGQRRGERWIAALSGGIAATGYGDERIRELDLRIGVQTKEGHQIALLFGNGAAISEVRHENTGIGMSAPAPSQTPSSRTTASSGPMLPEYRRTIRNEAWFGVVYNYSIAVMKGLTIDPGVRAGVGNITWRLGLEIPVRYSVSDRISMECSVAATRIEPRDATPDDFVEFNATDRFIYEGSVRQPAFNALGVQIGVRVELTGAE